MSASRESPKITRKVDQTEAKAGAAPAPSGQGGRSNARSCIALSIRWRYGVLMLLSLVVSAKTEGQKRPHLRSIPCVMEVCNDWGREVPFLAIPAAPPHGSRGCASSP